MSKETKSNYDDDERYRLTPRGKRVKKLARTAVRVATSKAAKHTAVLTAAAVTTVGAGVGLVELYDRDYEFKGDQPVQIGNVGEQDGTLREAIFNNVDGVNGVNIGDVQEYVVENPKNASVLKDADGIVVDSADIVHMPESVKEK